MTSDTPDGLAPLPDLGGDMAPMEGGLPDLGTPMGGGELPDIGSPMGGQMPAMGGDMPSLGNEMPVMGEAFACRFTGRHWHSPPYNCRAIENESWESFGSGQQNRRPGRSLY